MKLRINGNSIRLRLQQSEVMRLHEQGQVVEVLALGVDAGGDFCYRLHTVHGEQALLRHHQGELAVGIPRTWAEALANTDKVGYSVEVPGTSGLPIRLSVEKDFKCLTERLDEDERDAFPHPHTTKARAE